jgi:hypothetical protein
MHGSHQVERTDARSAALLHRILQAWRSSAEAGLLEKAFGRGEMMKSGAAFWQRANALSGVLVFPVLGALLSILESGPRIAIWLTALALALALLVLVDLHEGSPGTHSKTRCTASGSLLLATAATAAAWGTSLASWHSVLAWTAAVCLASVGGLLAAFGTLSDIQ